jgi:hypothetical protein
MKRSASPVAPVYTCAMKVRGLDRRTGVVLCLWLAGCPGLYVRDEGSRLRGLDRRTGVVLCLWLGFGRYLTRLPGVAVAGSAWRLFLVASASLRSSLDLAICVRVSRPRES